MHHLLTFNASCIFHLALLIFSFSFTSYFTSLESFIVFWFSILEELEYTVINILDSEFAARFGESAYD